MIKPCSFPLRRRMTGSTSLRRACRLVIRIGGLVISRQVTARAVRGGPGKPVVGMALRTCDVQMSTCQLKFRCAIVIKVSAFPLDGVVADRAILWEAGGSMIGIGGCIVIYLVTANALHRRPCVLPADVTLVTTDAGMGAGQGEAR